MRRSIAAGIWLALTVTATLIVWAAVSVVAADVTDRPAPVVAHRDVVVALQAGSGEPTTSSTTSTTAPRVAPAATTPARSATTTTTPGRAAAPLAPAGQATTTTLPRATTTTTKPPARPPTTTSFAGGTATYSNEGGVVAVGCTSFNTIRLVAALPFDGYQALVTSGGPLFVQVNFVRPTRNISVSAACFFGQPIQFNKTTTPPPGG